MIGQMLLLSALTFSCQEQPQVELVLKGTYRIGRTSADGIVPLGSQYLCIVTRRTAEWQHAYVKIFDRRARKVVFENETSMMTVDTLARLKDYIYARTIKKIFRIHVKGLDTNNPPILGPAEEVDIHGEELEGLEGLLHTDTAVAFRTKNNKIYRLEDGVAKKANAVDVPNLAADMVNENQARLKRMLVKLVNTESGTKLVIATSHRLRAYDFQTLRIDGDFPYSPAQSENPPSEVTYAEGKYILIFFGNMLRVIDSERKSRDFYNIPDGTQMVYTKSKKAFLLPQRNEINLMATMGKLETPYVAPRAIREILVVEDKVYLGISEYEKYSEDVYIGGGDLLEFEIKVNRR
jgi:hypothetical protein